jgi:hypothetical protein
MSADVLHCYFCSASAPEHALHRRHDLTPIGTSPAAWACEKHRRAPLKAFTIWQPWASLIMIGAKPYEFRPKSYLRYIDAPAIGERIVVHAGARRIKPIEIDDLLDKLQDPDNNATGLIGDLARPLLERVRAAYKCQGLPLGVGLGTAIIGKPRNAGVIFGGLPHDSDRGDFNWAWPLSDVRHFEPPIPARGQQGFWRWTGRIA